MLVDARDDGTFMQHYFDSRGVVRLYATTFDGTRWTLAREGPRGLSTLVAPTGT